MKIALRLFGCFDSVEELKQELLDVVAYIEMHGVESNPNYGSIEVDFDCFHTELLNSWEVVRDYKNSTT